MPKWTTLLSLQCDKTHRTLFVHVWDVIWHSHDMYPPFFESHPSWSASPSPRHDTLWPAVPFWPVVSEALSPITSTSFPPDKGSMNRLICSLFAPKVNLGMQGRHLKNHFRYRGYNRNLEQGRPQLERESRLKMSHGVSVIISWLLHSRSPYKMHYYPGMQLVRAIWRHVVSKMKGKKKNLSSIS